MLRSQLFLWVFLVRTPRLEYRLNKLPASAFTVGPVSSSQGANARTITKRKLQYLSLAAPGQNFCIVLRSTSSKAVGKRNKFARIAVKTHSLLSKRELYKPLSRINQTCPTTATMALSQCMRTPRQPTVSLSNQRLTGTRPPSATMSPRIPTIRKR